MAETINTTSSSTTTSIKLEDIEFRNFRDEQDLQTIISLIEKELSEPYPIYTYRYFVQLYPDHTFLAF
jgi:peptide alpha-N-acetyltransferase